MVDVSEERCVVALPVRTFLFALLAATSLTLSACGGGGGGGTTPPGPVPTGTPVPTGGNCPAPPAPGNGTAYAVGASRTWCVAVATIGTSNITYQGVAATLAAQGPELNVWVDNADIGQLTTPQWQQVANDFTSIYAAD
ncbi:MAG: hypothetical protein KGM44_12965, partial [bacterium]|nr:hypothetical protein [bacterium]